MLRPSGDEKCRLKPYEPQSARPGNTTCKAFHETRDTRHESRNSCCPVTASLPAISHYGLLASIPYLPGIARVRPTRSRVRASSAVLGRSHDDLRWPQLPSLSGLVPVRRTPNEPMPRKGNVLDYANEATFYMTLTPDRTGRRAELVNRYNRLAWTSHHAARHGAAVRGKTVRTRRGSPGALLPCPLTSGHRQPAGHVLRRQAGR